MADDMVHLRTAGGAVIGFTLPLHETIDFQWRSGDLERVTEDGSPWEGDGTPDGLAAEEVPAGTPDGADGDGDGAPVRPAASAAKQAWQDYAVAVGAATEDEAAGMTRADLIAASTPPELDPLAKGE